MKRLRIVGACADFLKNKKHQKVVGTGLVVFVVVNFGLAVIYNGRAYPKTKLGTSEVGGQSFGKIKQNLTNLSTKQATISLSDKSNTATIDTARLGLNIDPEATVRTIKQKRSFLPMLNLVTSHSVDTAVGLNQKAYDEEFAKLKGQFDKAVTEANIKLSGSQFVISDSKDGYELDKGRLEKEIGYAFANKISVVSAPLNTLKPTITKESLAETLKNVQARLALDIRMKYQDKEHRATTNDIGTWIVVSGKSFSVSKAAVNAYIDSVSTRFGIKAANKDKAAEAINAAVITNTKLAFVLLRPTTITYNYCVSLKNVEASFKDDFVKKAAAVYAGSLGWSLGGKVRFVKVDNGCDYTVWLSAADQMPSFGGVCDSEYSCQIGTNVVVNFDRWRKATPSWNEAGGTLDDYRTMVINHETGHWLGFFHLNCPGPGQPAPVMQQQSISLQGCKFNPWPTPAEKASLDSRI